jgi:hypothetical protein
MYYSHHIQQQMVVLDPRLVVYNDGSGVNHLVPVRPFDELFQLTPQAAHTLIFDPSTQITFFVSLSGRLLRGSDPVTIALYRELWAPNLVNMRDNRVAAVLMARIPRLGDRSVLAVLGEDLLCFITRMMM